MSLRLHGAPAPQSQEPLRQLETGSPLTNTSPPPLRPMFPYDETHGFLLRLTPPPGLLRVLSSLLVPICPPALLASSLLSESCSTCTLVTSPLCPTSQPASPLGCQQVSRHPNMTLPHHTSPTRLSSTFLLVLAISFPAELAETPSLH
ncbi:unnamed protein product [Dicrocoelium dendriticum]|nr:unnamed protein product [Dicrocoelium dendriticum]